MSGTVAGWAVAHGQHNFLNFLTSECVTFKLNVLWLYFYCLIMANFIFLQDVLWCSVHFSENSIKVQCTVLEKKVKLQAS